MGALQRVTIPILLALAVSACTVPLIPQLASPGSADSAAAPQSPSATSDYLALIPAGSAQQTVFLSVAGARTAVSSISSTGTPVQCVSAVGIVTLAELRGRLISGVTKKAFDLS